MLSLHIDVEPFSLFALLFVSNESSLSVISLSLKHCVLQSSAEATALFNSSTQLNFKALVYILLVHCKWQSTVELSSLPHKKCKNELRRLNHNRWCNDDDEITTLYLSIGMTRLCDELSRPHTLPVFPTIVSDSNAFMPLFKLSNQEQGEVLINLEPSNHKMTEPNQEHKARNIIIYILKISN